MCETQSYHGCWPCSGELSHGSGLYMHDSYSHATSCCVTGFHSSITLLCLLHNISCTHSAEFLEDIMKVQFTCVWVRAGTLSMARQRCHPRRCCPWWHRCRGMCWAQIQVSCLSCWVQHGKDGRSLETWGSHGLLFLSASLSALPGLWLAASR